MTITYVRWRDASYGTSGEYAIDETGLADLQECGFLLKEDHECLTISPEHQEDATTTRNWICVPKTGIIQRLDIPLSELLALMKARPTGKRRR